MKTEYISLYSVTQTLVKVSGRRWAFRIALSHPSPSSVSWNGSRPWQDYVSDLN